MLIEITDSRLWGSEPIAPSKSIVDLLDEEPLEVEIATTLLYEHCHHSYRQIRQAVQVAGEQRRREIIDLGLRMYATKSLGRRPASLL